MSRTNGTGIRAPGGMPRPLLKSSQAQRPTATPSGRPASRASPVTMVACQATVAWTCRRTSPSVFSVGDPVRALVGDHAGRLLHRLAEAGQGLLEPCDARRAPLPGGEPQQHELERRARRLARALPVARQRLRRHDRGRGLRALS